MCYLRSGQHHTIWRGRRQYASLSGLCVGSEIIAIGPMRTIQMHDLKPGESKPPSRGAGRQYFARGKLGVCEASGPPTADSKETIANFPVRPSVRPHRACHRPPVRIFTPPVRPSVRPFLGRKAKRFRSPARWNRFRQRSSPLPPPIDSSMRIFANLVGRPAE